VFILSSNITLVDITLEYKSKANAVKNLDKINTESFRKELVSALQNQDAKVFENVVVTPAKVTRLIQQDTTDTTKLAITPPANAGGVIASLVVSVVSCCIRRVTFAGVTTTFSNIFAS
jgi:hypothetical protein